jgi:hypothetical protein
MASFSHLPCCQIIISFPLRPWLRAPLFWFRFFFFRKRSTQRNFYHFQHRRPSWLEARGRTLPVVASAMHGRVRATIVKAEFLGPSRDVLRALIVVLATAPVRRCVAAQVWRSVGPIALTAPLCVRNNVEIVVSVPSSPGKILQSARFASLDSTGFRFCWIRSYYICYIGYMKLSLDERGVWSSSETLKF